MPTPNGWEPKRCGANKTSGGKCMRWAIRGGARCPIHGGSNKAVKAKALERIADGKMVLAVKAYGLPLDITPAEAFNQEIARTNGHVSWLSEKIQEMPEHDLIWGIVRQVTRSGTSDEQNWDEEELSAIAHIWLGLYFKERQHLVKVADTMIKNGLTEMQLNLNARLVEVFEAAMLGMLTDLRIDTTDPTVRTIISARMGEAAAAAAQPLVIEKAK